MHSRRLFYCGLLLCTGPHFVSIIITGKPMHTASKEEMALHALQLYQLLSEK